MGKKRNSKPNKLGRNDPCFCRSGLKYKKCCLLKGLKPPELVGEVPQEVMEAYNRSQWRTNFLHDRGIYINLPNTITFQGKSFLAVGNKVMYRDDPHSSFHQLILQNLSHTLDKEWWDAESVKPVGEKHYIKQCFEELKGSDERDDLDITVVDEHTRTMLATGNTQALLSLAFDVYLLTHKGYMTAEWLKRLRDHEEYQGVRYEIGVASLFVRMGCGLEFYDPTEKDENDRRPKRAEFIAIHNETGNKVAVEAKSRQRDGVIHRPGTLNYRKALRGDINQLYKRALEKKIDGLPLIVFIDVNSPTEVDKTVDQARWYKDVRKSFESRPQPTPENPDKHTALFVTNYSSHYQGESVSHPGQYLFVGSIHPQYPFADGHLGVFMNKLLRAVGGYGYVPPSMDNSRTEMYQPTTIVDKEDFIEKIRELIIPRSDDSEFEKKKTEATSIIEMLLWDTIQKGGGEWSNEVASESFKQFEWLYRQP